MLVFADQDLVAVLVIWKPIFTTSRAANGTSRRGLPRYTCRSHHLPATAVLPVSTEYLHPTAERPSPGEVGVQSQGWQTALDWPHPFPS